MLGGHRLKPCRTGVRERKQFAFAVPAAVSEASDDAEDAVTAVPLEEFWRRRKAQDAVRGVLPHRHERINRDPGQVPLRPGGVHERAEAPQRTGRKEDTDVTVDDADQRAWVAAPENSGKHIAGVAASGEAIVRYEPAPRMAGTTGDIEALSMWAGQSVALARQPQSAADIVTELTSRLNPAGGARAAVAPPEYGARALGRLRGHIEGKR